MILNLEFVYNCIFEFAQIVIFMFLGYSTRMENRLTQSRLLSKALSAKEQMPKYKLYCKQLITALNYGDNSSHIQRIMEAEVGIFLSPTQLFLNIWRIDQLYL